MNSKDGLWQERESLYGQIAALEEQLGAEKTARERAERERDIANSLYAKSVEIRDELKRERDALAVWLENFKVVASEPCTPDILRTIAELPDSLEAILRAHDEEKDKQVAYWKNVADTYSIEQYGRPCAEDPQVDAWMKVHDNSLMKPAIEALENLLMLWSSFHGDSEDNDTYKPIIDKCTDLLEKLRKEQPDE